MNTIAVLVLAAGKSSRMSSIKQLEKIGNKTLLDIILEKVKSIFSNQIYCVLGANSDIIQEKITTKNIYFINNKNFETGLSSSIVTGIHNFKKNDLKFDGVLILLADQPAISIEYLDSLVNLFHQHKTKIIASNYGNKFGVPAIFPNTYFDDLLLIKGDKGAKEFINQRKEEILSPKISSNFVDIDTNEDLQKFKNSILK